VFGWDLAKEQKKRENTRGPSNPDWGKNPRYSGQSLPGKARGGGGCRAGKAGVHFYQGGPTLKKKTSDLFPHGQKRQSLAQTYQKLSGWVLSGRHGHVNEKGGLRSHVQSPRAMATRFPPKRRTKVRCLRYLGNKHKNRCPQKKPGTEQGKSTA